MIGQTRGLHQAFGAAICSNRLIVPALEGRIGPGGMVNCNKPLLSEMIADAQAYIYIEWAQVDCTRRYKEE